MAYNSQRCGACRRSRRLEAIGIRGTWDVRGGLFRRKSELGAERGGLGSML